MQGQFVVFGIDVLNNPSVGTNSTGGQNNQGTVRINGGNQPFQDDDIVVFNAVNLTADGEIGPGGAISDVTVYENLSDFQNGIIKFNYAPQNPGQTANVQSDISGLGDGYVRFNANVLIPQDGGPSFSQLLVAPGTNLAQVTMGGGTVNLDRNQDFDFNGDGDFNDPVEAGNNRFFVGDYTAPPPCFTAGTRIRTVGGNQFIEDLKVGDTVVTYDHGAQVIRWVGRRCVAARGVFAPVRIAANVMGNSRNLEVSQNHRMLHTGPAIHALFGSPQVLVPAKFLVGTPGITLRETGFVDYIHLLFDNHEVIWAEDALSESLFPSDDLPNAELFALFPQLKTIKVPAARLCLGRKEAELLR